MTTEVALRPSYWASVSGGKDSLYMLNYILHNLDRYPLDGVVHFELEIDYPFIHNVIDYMESECKRFGIKFVRIKPRKSWEELYNKYGFPIRTARWCNNRYKLDARKQLDEWLNEVGFYAVCYIGYCADEERRFNKRLTAQRWKDTPLQKTVSPRTKYGNGQRHSRFSTTSMKPISVAVVCTAPCLLTSTLLTSTNIIPITSNI